MTVLDPDLAGAALLSGTDAERAAEAVGLVAERLADPDGVAATASREDNREPIYNASMWGAVTLSHGLPGTATLYAELARFDPRWSGLAHRHLQRGGEAMSATPANGLHAGPASLLAAAQTCAAGSGHYAGLRRKLADWLAEDQVRRLGVHAARAAAGERGVPWAAYDVIHGLSGTARVLLDSAEDPAEAGAAVDAALERTLRHLVRLTEPVRVRGREVPGWWVPPELQPVDQDRVDYPEGDFNAGMAHGITGPLAVLSLACQRGREVAGQRDAIRRVADWLFGWTLTDGAGAYWPCRVSWADQVEAPRPRSAFTRTAWCYGAPGVASALFRAGEALDVPAWREAAVAALHAALARDESAWRVDGPTVCHGYAGLLQVLWRVGTAAGEVDLLAGARRVARSVLDHADEASAFVFAHLVPDSPQGWRHATGYRALDVAGILEGAAGVACALLSVTPPHLLTSGETRAVDRDHRAWDRCLALS